MGKGSIIGPTSQQQVSSGPEEQVNEPKTRPVTGSRDWVPPFLTPPMVKVELKKTGGLVRAIQGGGSSFKCSFGEGTLEHHGSAQGSLKV